MMLLYGGNFHKVLLKLTESPYKEVQYNCAGIIGHLAMNGSFKCIAMDKPFSIVQYNTVPVQYSTIQYSTVLYLFHAVQYSTVPSCIYDWCR